MLKPQLQRSATLAVNFNVQNFIRRYNGPLTEKYELGEQIGEGAFGSIYICYDRSCRSEKAVKVVRKSEDPAENENILHEFEVMKNLDHPNIIKVYELYEDEENFYIVTEIYKGGQLFDVIVEDGPFSERDAASLMVNIMSCVNYYHKKGIVHRDLKPENILLDDNRKKVEDIKIIDFGLSTTTCMCGGAEETDGRQNKSEIACGSLPYMSPEALQGVSNGGKGDIWACGVIAFILLSGYAPFHGSSDEEIMDQIQNGTIEFEYDVWDSVSSRAKDFIRYLLNPDDDARPTAEQVLRHPWLAMQRSNSSKMFKRRNLLKTQRSLSNLHQFQAQYKLKQATYALISSQLLSKEEKDEIDSVFREIDSDCNGQLDYEEVRNGFKEFFNVQMSDEELAELFKNVDLDNTGTIEYSEFLVACVLQKDMMNDSKLRAAFNLFDADGDGQIGVEDLEQCLSLGPEMKSSVKAMLREADIDGDGLVSFQEFRTMMQSTKKKSTFAVKENLSMSPMRQRPKFSRSPASFRYRKSNLLVKI